MNHNKIIVVTSIIENDNKILILKRSEKVKSFKHKWAGISGYFEKDEDLLSRALIEIYEETKVKNKDLILRKILKQITIKIGNEKVITIQPFYFLSKTKNISTDWEHSEYKWIKEDQLSNYELVPKLIDIISECFLIKNK
jgi:8-oxo-dGTP pyrophosphatase MutT (NUDIX family)